MNIAFVLHTLERGGAARATVNLANELTELGYSVSIITSEKANVVPYFLHGDIDVIDSDMAKKSTSAFDAFCNTWSRIKKINHIAFIRKIDVLIGMSYTANVLVAMACLGTKVKAIGSERSHPANKKISTAWRWICKIAYSQLDLVIALTADTKQWLSENTFARKIVVIPNGIKLPLVDGGGALGFEQISSSRNYIISTGRVVDTKQMSQLVSIFARLASEFIDWDCIILGDGPEIKSLRNYVDWLGLGGRVIVPGSVGNVGSWLSRSDVYISTSILEGFPNGLLEGMAYGLPAISYDCMTGPADLIDHGKTGFLVDVNDRDSIEMYLRTLMLNKLLRVKIGENAMRDVKNRFSLDEVVSLWEEQLCSFSKVE